MIDYSRLDINLSYMAKSFECAKPFSHIVIDNLVQDGICEGICNEFNTNKSWDIRKDEKVQVKTRSSWKSEDDVPPVTLAMIRELNSGKFLERLSRITGVCGIIPDPYLTGGGFNVIKRGGCLAVHADGNWHDWMRIHRRLNVILFLNKDWNLDWGGNLEFWSHFVRGGEVFPKKPEREIEPLWNRMVIFKTTDFTMHGHPKPLMCPEDRERRSLILYYYTSERPVSELLERKKHRAIFKVCHTTP